MMHDPSWRRITLRRDAGRRIMTREAMLIALARQTGLTVAEVGEVVRAMAAIASEALVRGRVVRLGRELGALHPVTRAAKRSRNPRTGEPILVPARPDVRFKISTALRRRLDARESDG